ncbi:MAG: glycosyltransferase [Propionicimonas sp.]
MAETAALILAGWWLATVALRLLLARRVVAAEPPAPSEDPSDVTVMQPILSGDPLLPLLLAENLAHHPTTRFLWLVDADDVEGRRITAALARSSSGQVQVLLTPSVPAGLNPKVFKLVLGLPHCGAVVAILDDDTVLPTGALAAAREALARGELVTGLPVYRPGDTPWSRLVAAFVNGNAAITYLPLLAFGPPVTINGMFCLTRRDTLEAVGGFAAIADRLCDDLELARLYRAGGLRIVQTAIVHPLATSVPHASDYARLMRRWMVFAGQLLREELTLPMLALVVLPTALPLAALVVAIASGTSLTVAAVLAALVTKALVMADFRARVLGTAALGVPDGAATVAAELVADLVQPVHALAALVRPGRIRWRDRTLSVVDGGVGS